MQFEDIVNKWKGVKYNKYGQFDNLTINQSYGCNCAELVINFSLDCGLRIDNPNEIKTMLKKSNTNVEEVDGVVSKICQKSNIKDIQEKDILLFNITRLRSHLAVVTRVNNGEIFMLHQDQVIGKSVENILDQYWLNKLWGCYRYN